MREVIPVVIETANRSVTIQAEVACSRAERALGLMGRASLEPDAGMIFLVPEPRVMRMWMAETPLALPDRPDGPPAVSCYGFTHVAFNASASELFVTDFCDGTFTRVRIDLTGAPAPPWPRERFQIAAQQTPFAPSNAVGLLRAPGWVRVRRGVPGVDYRTPDVFVVAGQPDSQLCALRVESQLP